MPIYVIRLVCNFKFWIGCLLLVKIINMTRAILLLFFFVSLRFSSAAQSYFQNVFGDSTVSEKGQLIYQTNNGTIYLFGSGLEGVNDDAEITLHKLSADGQVISKQLYADTGDEYLFSMVYNNGVFVIVGEQHIAGTNDIDGLIMMVDTAGQVLNYQLLGTASKTESLHGISQTSDGGYIVCGFVTGRNNVGNDFLTIKFNADLSIAWQKAKGSPLNDVGMKTVELPNGNFLSSGDQHQASGNYNVYCQLFDPNGTFLFDKTVTTPYNGGSKNALLDSDNNVLIIGEMNNAASIEYDMYLVKMDINANVIWTKYTTTSLGGDAGFCVIEPNVGDYIMTGYGTNPITQNQDIIIVSTDTSGNIIDTKYYGGSDPDLGYTVVPSVNGGFIIGGFVAVNSDAQYCVIYDNLNVAVSTQEISSNEENLLIYPNPVTQQVLRFNTAIEQVNITIYNTNGVLIEQRYFDQTIKEYHLKNDLPLGNYFINFQFEKYSKTIQIIIQ